eukprot:1743209-Rhodomonas_salina.1
MQDRPDLIQSELAGLAFDSLQQAFRPVDIERVLSCKSFQPEMDEMIFISIDPAAGGPQSDYCVVSFVRQKGCVKVSQFTKYSCRKACTRSPGVLSSVLVQVLTTFP